MPFYVGNVFVTTLNFCSIKRLRSINPGAMRLARTSLNMRHAYDGSIQQKGTRHTHERRHETDTPTMLLCSSCSSRFRGAGPKWGWLDRAIQTLWCPQGPDWSWEFQFAWRSIELALSSMSHDGKRWRDFSGRPSAEPGLLCKSSSGS